MRRERRPLLGWMAALASALCLLHALGSGPLGVPVTSAHDLRTWVDQSSPELMALALVRLAALAGAWYLMSCTVLLALCGRWGRPRLAAVLARVTPAWVRRLVSQGGVLGLATGTLLGTVPAAGVAGLAGGAAPSAAAASVAAVGATDARESRPPPVTATMRRIPMPASGAATATMAPSPGPGATATMAPSPGPGATATMVRSPGPPATEHPAVGQPAATMARPAHEPAGATAGSTWIVEPGDSFWSIAAETVASPGKGEPDDGQVVRYWRLLIDANRGRLLDAGNPDLLVPGQQLVLPDQAR